MTEHVVDASNLRRVFLESPNQFAQGCSAARDCDVPKHFSSVMISGMGGSALPASVLRTYIHHFCDVSGACQHFPIYQNRFYTLPPEAYHDCLNVICSHSGNTEETIASFEEAVAHKLPCVGVSAGGAIERLCKEHNLPHVKLPIPFAHFQPRVATGHFVAAIVQVLVNAGKLPTSAVDFDSTVQQLRAVIPNLEAQGKAMAQKIVGKTPVVYASTKFKSLAMIWKIKLNEHAKTPAFWNYFPELNHNEFVGFTNPQSQFYVIMLRDGEDHPRNVKRFAITAKFLEEKGVEVEIVDMPEGDDVLFRIFATLALGDWVAYYLALAYGQDPTPVDMVEDFKKALK